MKIIGQSADLVAAVMAHEFAHLLLGHSAEKLQALQRLRTEYLRVLRQSENQDFAREYMRKKYGDDVFERFFRELEKDADDKGFAIETTAGYELGAFQKAAQAMLQAGVGNRTTGFLDDHPGWLERLGNSEKQASNQAYLSTARKLNGQKDWKGLSLWLRRWLQAVPSSPAAWYYQGRMLIRTSGSSTAILSAFEKSVALYTNNPELGELSQEDQFEAGIAWGSLCQVLFDDGYRWESANCARHIKDDIARQRFISRTFGNLFVGGPEAAPTNLLTARSAGGGKLLTNDEEIAKSHGGDLQTFPAWKAIQFPRLSHSSQR